MSISPVPGNDPSKWPYPYNRSIGGLPAYNFTTAQLLALSPAACAEIRQAFCTDCLSLRGTGATVYYNNSAWRTHQYDLPITTDLLTFFRSIVSEDARGQPDSFPNTYRWLENTNEWTFSQGWLNSDYENAYVQLTNLNGLNYAATLALSLNASSVGILNDNTFGKPLLPIECMLISAQVSVDSLSSHTNTYNFRLGLGTQVNYQLQSDFVGFVYDEGNALDDLNEDRTDNWLCLTRSNGVNTIVNSGVTPSVGVSVQNLLEIYYSPTNVKFYIDGIQVASISTNIPSIPTTELVRSLVFNKTKGSDGNFIYLSAVNLVARYQ